MVCKFCGCENLDGSTRCVYCGEPLSGKTENVSEIMSAFAGVAAAQTEAVETENGFRVVSSMSRLRRTDVSQKELISEEEKQTAMKEARALMDAAEDETEELSREMAEAAGEVFAEAVPEPAPSVPAPPIPTPKSLSDQAAEIVNRAVERIVGGNREHAPAVQETEKIAEEAEEIQAGLEAAQAESLHHRLPEQPENPLDFTIQEVNEPAEPEDHEIAGRNFVLAAAAAVPAKKPAEAKPAEVPETAAADTAFAKEEAEESFVPEEPEQTEAGEPAEESSPAAWIDEPPAVPVTASLPEKEEAEEPFTPDEREKNAQAEPAEESSPAAWIEEPAASAAALMPKEEPDEPFVPEDAEKTDETGAAEESSPAAWIEEAASPAAVLPAREEPDEPFIPDETEKADGHEPAEESAPAGWEAEEEKAEEGDYIPSIALTDTKEVIREKLDEINAREDSLRKNETEKAEPEKPEEAPRRKFSWLWLLIGLIACLLLFLLFIQPLARYNRGQALLAKGDYRGALTQFERSGNFRDAAQMADECLKRMGAKVPGTDPVVIVPTTTVPSTEGETPSQTKPVTPSSSAVQPSSTAAPVTDPTTTVPDPTTTVADPTTEPVPPSSSEPIVPPSSENPPETPSVPDVHVGDFVAFGQYEQNNSSVDGPEALDWVVLEVRGDDTVLLISRYILDVVKFNNTLSNINYASSSIRSWLNGYFYDLAFTEEEKAGIVSSPDAVTMLSVDQILQYMTSNGARCCDATPYAKGRNIFVSDNGCSPWWTSSMGSANTLATLVRSAGTINYEGREVTVDTFGVRPVVIVKLSALK